MSEHDDPAVVPTVRDRLVSAGLSPERIESHLRTGRIALDPRILSPPTPNRKAHQ